MTRGALMYPSEDFVAIVSITYIVFKKLLSISEFQRSTRQRSICVSAAMEVVDDENLSFLVNKACLNGHLPITLCRMAVWITVNTLLNNYCSVENDKVSNNKLAKRRKLQTLT